MPIALDPDRTVWIQLPSDKDKPDAPAFRVRFATCRVMDEYMDALEAAKDCPRDREASRMVTAALERVVVGWRNLPGEFGPGAIDSVLTWLEKWELAYAYPREVSLAESDLKKSVSPSQSAGAASANDVPAAAPTSPPNEARS